MDANGLPVQLGLTPGEAHDNRLCPELLAGLQPRSMLLADRGYDADWIRALVNQQRSWVNIPPRPNRKEPICVSPYLYRARNLVERFFNKTLSSVSALRPATTSSRRTTLPSSSLHQSASDCRLMSLRPNQGRREAAGL